MDLIDTSVITTEVKISDKQLKDRMTAELMAALGMLDEAGKPKPGVTAAVLRYGDRNSGGYQVRVTRDLSKSTDKALPAPGRG